MRIRQNKNTWLIALGVFVAVFLFAFLTAKFKGGEDVEAADLGKFDPGYIISDYQMGNYNAMSEAEIQAFLTKKNPCNNTNYNYYLQLSSSSAATWHFANGHFVCLSEERFGDGETIGSGDTAAHIIWQTAQDYRINPQVLIVLLQKETGLITDPIPNNYDYRKATGYGCPDTAACSSKSYGFKNQVRNAAALFRMVLDGGWTNYPLGSNYIQYNPSAACGGSWVNIRSLATSALYRYTPYQPNASALAAGYGVGDSCGAYGNRNFYNYFEDWFGGIIDENVSDEKQIVDGVYYIEHKNSKNKVLNATGGRNVKGTNIELWSKEELLHQTWKIMYDDGYYRIQDAYSGLFVDLYGTSIKNGANIQLWSRNDSCSQKWEIKKTDNGYYKIMSTCGEEKAIDLNGGNLANGTNVQIWEDDGTDAQEWNLKPATVIAEGSYVLAAKKNGAKALDVNGALKNNGTNVQLWDQHRGGAQIWYISYDEETDDYSLINPNSGKALDVVGASSNDGANVQLWERSDSCAQRWKIVQTLDNYYSLISSCSDNEMLDMYGASTNNGTNIQLWHNNLGDAQKWSIIPASVVADGVYTIESKIDDKKNLDVYGASSENGANVQLWAGSQKWRITYNYDTGFYEVVNLGKSLDAYGAYTQSGTNIQLWAQNRSCAQMWRILRTADGYYTFMNGCSQSYVLDMDDASGANGTNIRLWHSNGEDVQKWILQR